jgi:hypothetical protein
MYIYIHAWTEPLLTQNIGESRVSYHFLDICGKRGLYAMKAVSKKGKNGVEQFNVPCKH